MSRLEPDFVVVTEANHVAVLEGIPVLSAEAYVEGTGVAPAEDVAVVNLCASTDYLTPGYYVAMFADARRQRCFPSFEALERLRQPATALRALREAGIEAVVEPAGAHVAARPQSRALVVVGATGRRSAYDAGLAAAAADDTQDDGRPYREIWSVFGRTRDTRHAALAGAVFRTFELPLARIRLYESGGTWKVGSVAALAVDRLDPAELDLLRHELATGGFLRARPVDAEAPRPVRIACLWDAGDPLAASDRDTLDRFARLAARRGLVFETLGCGDLDRLATYDALFIRTVTAIDHASFGFAQAAVALGMPVIDDPQTILKCSNKVYLSELFRRHGIPAPRTRVVSRATPLETLHDLGFPLIVKLPDGTFSQAVERADDAAQLQAIAAAMLARSPLLVVQEFVPTAFDWRVGVLDGRPLFACKYHMAEGHWQIVKAHQDGEHDYGRVEALPLDATPAEVLRLALASTALLGYGLYGVDLKDTPSGPVVIEINDNPNIQEGYEDGVEGDRIYDAVFDTFESRVRAAVRVTP